jgi:ABC-type antimicrobial peptide transport system permease subunit
MKAGIGKVLMGLGAVFVVGFVIAWGALGANTAWTKTYVEIPREDPITGIAYSEKVERFVPGVDLLIPAVGAGFICVLAGWVIFKRTSKP